MERDKSVRNLTLDGFRLIATIVIVLSHFEFIGVDNYSYSDFYNRYLHNAVMAVDYFFLLSGYGSYCYLRNKPIDVSIRNSVLYVKNRNKKIYPYYCASMLIMIPHYFYSSHGSVMSRMLLFFARAPLSAFLIQSALGTKLLSHFLNGVCWFLSCITIISLFVPIICKFINKHIYTKRDAAFSFFISLVSIYFISVLFLQIESLSWFNGRLKFDDLFYGSPYIRIWYVIIGIIIARFNDLHKLSIKNANYIESVVSIILLVYFVIRNTFISEVLIAKCNLRVVDIVLCSGAVLLFSNGNGFISAFLKKLGNVGKTSFIIYLFHYPIKYYILDMFNLLKLDFGDVTGLVEAIIICVISIIVCLICSKSKPVFAHK